MGPCCMSVCWWLAVAIPYLLLWGGFLKQVSEVCSLHCSPLSEWQWLFWDSFGIFWGIIPPNSDWNFQKHLSDLTNLLACAKTRLRKTRELSLACTFFVYSLCIFHMWLREDPRPALGPAGPTCRYIICRHVQDLLSLIWCNTCVVWGMPKSQADIEMWVALALSPCPWSCFPTKSTEPKDTVRGGGSFGGWICWEWAFMGMGTWVEVCEEKSFLWQFAPWQGGQSAWLPHG